MSIFYDNVEAKEIGGRREKVRSTQKWTTEVWDGCRRREASLQHANLTEYCMSATKCTIHDDILGAEQTIPGTISSRWCSCYNFILCKGWSASAWTRLLFDDIHISRQKENLNPVGRLAFDVALALKKQFDLNIVRLTVYLLGKESSSVCDKYYGNSSCTSLPSEWFTQHHLSWWRQP